MSESKRVRRSKTQLIADLEAKIAKLKSSPPKSNKKQPLSKQSELIPELLAAFDAAAKRHSLSSGEMIQTLARLKRARLKITPTVETE